MSWVTKQMTQDWYNEWVGMPEYEQENKEPFKIIGVQFATQEDVDAFAKLTGAKITPRTQGIWFPPRQPKHIDKVFVDEDKK